MQNHNVLKNGEKTWIAKKDGIKLGYNFWKTTEKNLL